MRCKMPSRYITCTTHAYMYVVHVYFQKIFIINIYAVLPSRIKYMYVCTSGHAYYWYLLNTSSIITTIQKVRELHRYQEQFKLIANPGSTPL